MKHVWLGRLVALALLAPGCAAREPEPSLVTDTELRQDLATLATRRVYFAHQSVGYNLVSGLTDLADRAGVRLNVLEDRSMRTLPPAYFLHSDAGVNGNPESKYEAFRERLGPLSAAGVGIAFYKLCYTDITAGSDARRSFESYRGHLDTLERAYPETVFLRVTVPLTAPTWARRLMKRLLWRGDPRLDNIRRNEFNELLRQHCGGERLFDLARVESTRTDGSRATFAYADRAYDQLASEYTDDGGHLNAYGSRIAARELIRVLARAPMKVTVPATR